MMIVTTILTTINICAYFMLALTMIVAIVKKKVPQIIIDVLLFISLCNILMYLTGLYYE